MFLLNTSVYSSIAIEGVTSRMNCVDVYTWDYYSLVIAHAWLYDYNTLVITVGETEEWTNRSWNECSAAPATQ